MEDNGTVIQLKNALNQLLNAYESLKLESEEMKNENEKLLSDVETLELLNDELTESLDAVNNTTDHQSTEMGEMLGKIEAILSDTPDDSADKETEETTSTDDTATTQDEEVSVEEPAIKVEEPKDNGFSNNKDLDLGRMQSLLNGFNN